MSKTATIIEINGTRYDAATGAVLSSRPAFKPIDSIQKPVSRGGYDVQADTPAVLQPMKPLPAGSKSHFKPDVVRPAAVSVKHHAQAPAKTLMRSAVKKPQPGLKRQVKAVTRTDILAKQPELTVQIKHSVQVVHPDRLKRASSAQKSQHIKKFHHATVAHSASVAPQPVRPEPVAITPAAHAPAKAPAAQLFETALAHATSHEQKPVRTTRKPLSKAAKRSLHATLAILLVIVFGSFIAYHETAPLTVKLAASRAGFSAAMPDYQPAGFHLGAVNSGAGVVAMQYRSNSDARAYTLTEKPSNWDSSALLDQFVRQTTDNYEIVQSGGNTVYVYGQHNATWVSGGVWYQVQSNDALSTQQLVQLAASL